jgi:soluble lytic murein transglycosylase
MLKPARELRYQFSLHLAAAGHHSEFLEIYRQYYRDLGVAKLDCLALQAELREGRSDSFAERGLKLWLTGRSQANECDPVFAQLRANNLLSNEYYEERFTMAVDERRFSLARYLSQPLPENYREQADYWLEAQNDSLEFLRTHEDRDDDATARAQLLFAIERIAFSDHYSMTCRRMPWTPRSRAG